MEPRPESETVDVKRPPSPSWSRARPLSPVEPDAEGGSGQAIYQELVDTAIRGMPMVHFASLRRAYHEAGAMNQDMVYWGNPHLWTQQTPVPYHDIVALLFADLRRGPLILEFPPLEGVVSLSLFDAWGRPLPRAGEPAAEHEAGGRYVLLPPGHGATPPNGYLPVTSPSLGVGCALRVSPESGRTRELLSAQAVAKRVRIRSLLLSASAPMARFINATGKRFEGAPPRDGDFFVLLLRMLTEERPTDQGAAMLAQLAALGVREGAGLRPDPEAAELLRIAVAEANACVAEARRRGGYAYWPDRRWRTCAPRDSAAHDPLLTSPRGRDFAEALLDPGCHDPGTLHLWAFHDANGEPLDGSRSYTLRIPADVPTRRSWTVAAYDEETTAFVRGSPAVAVSSRGPRLVWSRGGALEVCFAPKPPQRTANWIATPEGRRFFVVFRNHAPDPSTVGQPSRWMMSDLHALEAGDAEEGEADAAA